MSKRPKKEWERWGVKKLPPDDPAWEFIWFAKKARLEAGYEIDTCSSDDSEEEEEEVIDPFDVQSLPSSVYNRLIEMMDRKSRRDFQSTSKKIYKSVVKSYGIDVDHIGNAATTQFHDYNIVSLAKIRSDWIPKMNFRIDSILFSEVVGMTKEDVAKFQLMPYEITAFIFIYELHQFQKKWRNIKSFENYGLYIDHVCGVIDLYHVLDKLKEGVTFKIFVKGCPYNQMQAAKAFMASYETCMQMDITLITTRKRYRLTRRANNVVEEENLIYQSFVKFGRGLGYTLREPDEFEKPPSAPHVIPLPQYQFNYYVPSPGIKVPVNPNFPPNGPPQLEPQYFEGFPPINLQI